MSDWGVGDKAGAEPFALAKVGNTPVALLFGEHPHSRSYNNVYARFPSGRVEPFDGYRLLTRVEIEESNYLKESELSGDEVRKGGSGRIYFNGQQVYEFFHRDAQRALLTAHRLIEQLQALPVMSLLVDEAVPPGDRLRGRAIFYQNIPALCGYTMPEQGAVMISPADPKRPFPAPAHDQEHLDDIYAIDREPAVKADILSKDIWWWRDA